MKYSFIVPVYNAEQYLSTCLDSILNQTIKDYEIIIIDDGSTDSSLHICKKYEENYEQVKVYKKKNEGAGAARKYACQFIRGEYVLPIDSDDFISPDYLANVDRIVRQYKPDHIVFNFYELHGDRKKLVKNECDPGYYGEEKVRALLDSFVYNNELPRYNCGCMMYSISIKVTRSALFQACQMQIPNSIRLGEDMILSARILQNAKSLFVSENAYYFYRMYDNSTLHRPNPKVMEYYNTTIREMKRMNLFRSETINVFAYRMLMTQISLFSKHYQKKKDFIIWVKSSYKNLELWKAAQKAKAHGLSISEALLRLLFELKLFNIIYFILHKHDL